MEEIIIEEKKYVSSRRAAKVTGYAKDYIGQLCREGRVPARLVGRSWYVLESAIQDHRFGAQDTEEESVVQASAVSPMTLETWESPRYESTQVESLPALDSGENGQGPEEDHKHIHDSWREWFDKIAESEAATERQVPVEIVGSDTSESEDRVENEDVEPLQEADGVAVPLHTMYEPVPRNLLPRALRATMVPSQEQKVEVVPRYWRFARSVQVAGVLVAVASVTLAAIGSGYFDSYVASDNRASLISGVILYNK